jgi:hypothetical protein
MYLSYRPNTMLLADCTNATQFHRHGIPFCFFSFLLHLYPLPPYDALQSAQNKEQQKEKMISNKGVSQDQSMSASPAHAAQIHKTKKVASTGFPCNALATSIGA